MAAPTMAKPASKTKSPPLVEVRGLSKTYKLMWGKEIRALDDVSFSIGKGETFAIVGPNGSGKTTAMKILLGLIFASEESTVTVFGEAPGTMRAQARIGYLPEAPYFYEFLNGRELLDYYGKLCGVPDAVRKPRIEDLLQLVNLLERGADMPVRYYSRGMRQRIGIAQAMINDPELLILDEPTNGLDPVGTWEVRQFILEQKKQGRTILLCSHLLSEVEAVADRVAILHKGQAVAIGPMSELVPESHQWQLVASRLSREAQAKLREVGFTFDVRAEMVTILANSLDEAYTALGIVRDMGGELESLARPQPTLEQQFLKAVGREKR